MNIIIEAMYVHVRMYVRTYVCECMHSLCVCILCMYVCKYVCTKYSTCEGLGECATHVCTSVRNGSVVCCMYMQYTYIHMYANFDPRSDGTDCGKLPVKFKQCVVARLVM